MDIYRNESRVVNTKSWNDGEAEVVGAGAGAEQGEAWASAQSDGNVLGRKGYLQNTCRQGWVIRTSETFNTVK